MIDQQTKQISKDIFTFLKRMRFKPTTWNKGDKVFFRVPLEKIPAADEYAYIVIGPGQVSILQDYYLEELAEYNFLDMSKKLRAYLNKQYGISLPMPDRSHGLGSGVTGYVFLFSGGYMKASDRLATRYACKKRASGLQAADSDIFVAFSSGNRLELRRYNFIRTFGWQDFKTTGDKVMKNLNKASQNLIKAIKDLSGVSYEGDQESISVKPLYLSIDVSPKGKPLERSVMKQAIKAAGLKEMRGIMSDLQTKQANFNTDYEKWMDALFDDIVAGRSDGHEYARDFVKHQKPTEVGLNKFKIAVGRSRGRWPRKVLLFINALQKGKYNREFKKMYGPHSQTYELFSLFRQGVDNGLAEEEYQLEKGK